ncbi:MAG: hypothetical protein ACOYBY_18970, partial [Dermatophilaceae bacterium]
MMQGRTARAVEVAGHIAAAALLVLVSWGLRILIPPEASAAHAMAWYTLWGAVVLAVYAIGLATARLPRIGPTSFEGSPTVGVSAWAGDAWVTFALDAGLAVYGGGVFLLDLSGGGGWLPWSLLPAALATWLFVRCQLYLDGSRCREAVFLTGTELVHQTSWGTQRANRADLVGVAAAGTLVAVVVARPPVRRPCPRPWRGRLPDARGIVI